MGIEWFRDLSITILGFVTTAVLIFAAVLFYRLYRVTISTLVIIKATSKKTHDIVTLLQEGIKPLIWILALIRGIRGGFDGISKIFKNENKEGVNNNE